MIAARVRSRLTAPLAVIVLASFAGCGDDEQEAEGREKLEEVIAQVEGLDGNARERKLLELARDEGGELVFYTSLNNDAEAGVADAFEDEYDIEVSVYRASSEALAQRVHSEADADFEGSDVIETNGTELALLDKEGVFVPYRPSTIDNLVEGSRENWTVSRLTKFVVAWNTRLVPEGSEPRTLEELAEPEWRDKVAIEASDSDWYSALHTYLQEKGSSEEEADAFFEKLAENSRVVSGHSLMAELLGSGEFSVAASNYEYLTIASIDDGAPVQFKPLAEPVLTRPQGVALLETATHPATALLFVEWLTGPGQEILPEVRDPPGAEGLRTRPGGRGGPGGRRGLRRGRRGLRGRVRAGHPAWQEDRGVGRARTSGSSRATRGGCRAFLRATISPEAARRQVEERLARREESFLDVLERAVFARPESVYARLFRWAGVESGDLRALVGEHGLEGALGRLHDAGVRVTLDEFKGRIPVERRGVSIEPDERAFENPLATPHYVAKAGGSRGAPRRISVDLESLEQETAYHALFVESFGLEDRPYGVWRVIPPNSSGLNNSLRHVKIGGTVERWFNPYRPPRDLEWLKFGLFTAYTVASSRILRRGLAAPEHCRVQDAERVAHWLAGKRAEGTPAVLDTQATYGVRACLAALENELDISGTFFRFGGEPLTEAKAAVVAEAGARAVCHYSMAETGRIGVACASASHHDDVHLLRDKLAILQRERVVDGAGRSVGALHYTPCHPERPHPHDQRRERRLRGSRGPPLRLSPGRAGADAPRPRDPQLREAHERGHALPRLRPARAGGGRVAAALWRDPGRLPDRRGGGAGRAEGQHRDPPGRRQRGRGRGGVALW